MQKKIKAIVGLPMGDAAGVGPELIVKAMEESDVTTYANTLVVGDAKIMNRAIRQLDSHLVIRICANSGEADFSSGIMNLVDLDNLPEYIYAKGEVDAASGKAAVEYIEAAVKMALAREIDAIASAPVNKEAMHKAGHDFAGVTELIASLTHSQKYSMVLVFGPIRLFYATNHVSMRKALDSISRDNILTQIRIVNEALGDFGIPQGKIAVAALNPHSGEGGAMGMEEITAITPAIQAAQLEGINALGPFPADTIFLRGKNAEFDAILSMYHDQGNIAAKLMDFATGVTFVSGLPIIRTSVAHGTAFDIAGRGIARSDGLIAAIKLAADIAVKRSLIR